VPPPFDSVLTQTFLHFAPVFSHKAQNLEKLDKDNCSLGAKILAKTGYVLTQTHACFAAARSQS
jgi:hypothetical protein